MYRRLLCSICIHSVQCSLQLALGTLSLYSGATIQSFGFIAQKKSHNKINDENKDKPKEEQKSVLSKWLWWVGIIVYSVGGAANSLSLNYAAQSIISPLTGYKLAATAVLSHFFLNEKLTVKDIVAVVIIIIGVLVVIIFGPSSDDVDVTIDDLRVYFQGVPYIITVCILSVITIAAYIGMKYVEKKNFDDEKNDDIVYGRNFLLFAYVWIGDFFASNNTLFIKASVSIIVSSFSSLSDLQRNASDWLSYFILVLWIACLLLMEYYRQKALSHFGALYVIPTFDTLGIVLVAIIGMVYFEEYKALTVLSACLFVLGIIVTICGVLVLSLDVGKLWSELYDEHIKVALREFDKSNERYPTAMCTGGPISEYLQNYFYRRPAVCYNPHIVKSNEMETEMLVH